MKKRIPLVVLVSTLIILFLTIASPVSAATLPATASLSGRVHSHSISTLTGMSSGDAASSSSLAASSCSGTSSTQKICKVKLPASTLQPSASAVFCPGALILITNQGYAWCIWGVDGNAIVGVTSIINANPLSEYSVYLSSWGFLLIGPLGFVANIGGQTVDYIIEYPAP